MGSNEHDDLGRVITLVVKDREVKSLDCWDKMERVSKALAVAAIPIVLAVSGFVIQSRLQDQTVKRDYVTLAVSILRESENATATPEMKTWAADLLNQNAPTQLPLGLLSKLKSGETTLPTGNVPDLLSTCVLKGEPCAGLQATDGGPTDESRFGPDSKEVMDRKRTFIATIPPRGRLSIALTSSTAVENAFVVDNVELTSQMRQGGNGWRNLLPLVVDNISESQLQVVISAWHKMPGASADSRWIQSELTVDAEGRLMANDGVDDQIGVDLVGVFHCQREGR